MEPKTENRQLTTPIAIVFAGVLVAGAVLYSNSANTGSNNLAQVAGNNQPSAALEQIRPVSNDDHIRGDKNAEVVIVEYSDTECPFCKQFHSTLKQVVTEYGDKVAWVYRHFPLDQLHSKARNEAVALECASDQGGNDEFWQFADRIYEITPANNGLDPAELPKIAEYIGLNVAEFNTCLASQKFAQKVEEDVQNAMATGGNGTPWSIVITKSGKKYPLSGAQPYASVKQLIETALQAK